MKTSDLVVGEIYVTKGDKKNDPKAVVVVDTSLTWHKKQERTERHSYYNTRRPRYDYAQPEFYQVKDKRQLEKYARGGIGVLYMSAYEAYLKNPRITWKPDVLAPKAFHRLFSEFAAEMAEEDRLREEKRQHNLLVARRSQITENRLAEMHQQRVNFVDQVVEKLVHDGALEDVKLPDYISLYQTMDEKSVYLSKDYLILPSEWAEPIFELLAKTDLWRRLAGVDE